MNLLDYLEQDFYESTSLYKEAEDNKIPDLIEPIVKILEDKGYMVKYSSPGHLNTNFKNDLNNDKVVNGKFNSTARVIFKDDYEFQTTPQGWVWKVLSNGDKALYVKPYSYNEESQGTNKESIFSKWQVFYLGNLKEWAENLPEKGKATKEEKEVPDTHFAAR